MKQGYTVQQWQKMRSNNLTYVKDAITSVTPFAGLTANALAHLREDWVSWRDEHVQITIPAEASCNEYKHRGGEDIAGQLPPLIERDKTCRYCRTAGNTDHFENLWNTGKHTDENGVARTYRTYLHRDLAKPAVDLLERVFKQYGRPEFALSARSIDWTIQHFEHENTEDGTAGYSKFIRTGPVLYCQYGLSADEIAEITPYTVDAVKQIVGRTQRVNFEKMDTRSFLIAINEMEPVTVKELMDRFDNSRPNFHHKLHRLKELDRVTVKNNHNGPPSATWKTTDLWDIPFECEICRYSTYSLNGITKHEDHKHGVRNHQTSRKSNE